MEYLRKPRDLKLLDAIDGFSREPFSGSVWRVVKEGRDPLQGASSKSRWCNGRFDALYTSFERDGAIAEIYSLLISQPVFPSKPRWTVNRLVARCEKTLRLPDLVTLSRLGVDTSNYKSRDYDSFQQIGDAAYFLDFDGLVVPSARWNCLNLILFTDRIVPANLNVEETEGAPMDWKAWKSTQR